MQAPTKVAPGKNLSPSVHFSQDQSNAKTTPITNGEWYSIVRSHLGAGNFSVIHPPFRHQ